MNCTQMDQYLDAMMDGVLSEAEQRAVEAHCADCAGCAEKLKVNRQMMRIFDEMAPEIDVPLTAQAAWRGSVRREVQQVRRRRIIRFAGGIAAALVVAMVATFALKAPEKDAASLRAAGAAEMAEMAAGEYEPSEEADMEAAEYEVAEGALIEADGAAETDYEVFSEAASSDRAMNMMAKASPTAPMHEIDLVVEYVDRVCDYALDLAQEYGGEIDIQRFDEDGVSCANLYIDLPQANAAEFLEAIRHFDKSDAGQEKYEVNGETSILLVLRSE